MAKELCSQLSVLKFNKLKRDSQILRAQNTKFDQFSVNKQIRWVSFVGIKFLVLIIRFSRNMLLVNSLVTFQMYIFYIFCDFIGQSTQVLTLQQVPTAGSLEKQRVGIKKGQ